MAAGEKNAPPTPALPAITEPAFDGQVISPFDVHMVAGPFSGAPGENHVCSDWEIRTLGADQPVWAASCVRGALAVHIHLGDGVFVNALAGHHQLDADRDYQLRVRFKGDQPPPDGAWSDWAERRFHTSPATAIPPMVLFDVASIPTPKWTDEQSNDVILPAGDPVPRLRLEVEGGGTILEFDWVDGAANRLSNPPASGVHGPLLVVCEAGGAAAVNLAASRLSFTDGSGQDRVVYLPPISLPTGQTAAFWIAESGGAFSVLVVGPGSTPDFNNPVSASPVPWSVKQPGYRVERFATGFQLPVNIAFVPDPGFGPDDPLFYVSGLYGSIKVVTRSGQVSDYATDLLNFDPNGQFPGSGEMGLTGIAVDPQSGDVFAAMVVAVPPVIDFHFPRVIRLHSVDGGRTAATKTTILDFPNEPVGPSHQISNVSIGPDGKLYVHIGDGTLTTPAQDLASVRGKILRVDLDGSAPPDNPFYDAADGITATDSIFAYGFRNPFGGAWRAADGFHWEVENGPSVDRLAKVVAGRNYLWDGTDASMNNSAAYLWPISSAPVNIAFVQPTTFGGSGFPAEKMDHAFVTESGPTYAPGPQAGGKRVSEFVFDSAGGLVSGPLSLIEYIGAGRATVSALAAGADGLYFADLYKDFGASAAVQPGANVFRIRYTGQADFSADVTAGPAPLTVSFRDSSELPAPAPGRRGRTVWHWDFGDGTQGDEENPVHVYALSGSFDVRLTVAGSGGETARERVGFISVAPPVTPALCAGEMPGAPCPAHRPLTRLLPPRN